MALTGLGREEFEAPMSEINTTPLVDVMLVLLVVFLVTAPMLTHSVKLQLPNQVTIQNKDRKAVTLSIDRQGNYFIDSRQVTAESLETEFQALANNQEQTPVHIRADTNVDYGHVSQAISAAQRAGIKNMGFITQPAP